MTLKKIRSLLVEIVFVSLCLCGSAFSIWQFWTSLNQSLTKNEEAIATISFKYKTAQRKFAEDLLWDRLQQNSPVYDGDTIRTAPLSEATIYFIDGNIMELYENTMARVSLKDGGAEIDFDGGQIEIQTTGNSGMTLKSGNNVVNIEQGASIAATAPKVVSKTTAITSADGNVNTIEGTSPSESTETPAEQPSNSGFSIQVKSGSAAISSDANSEAINLEAGQTAELSTEGTIQKKHLSITSPSKEEKYVVFEEGPKQVSFDWDCDDEYGAKIQIFTSKNMINPIATYGFSEEKSALIDIPAGTVWWKIISDDEYATGKINVVYSKRPKAIAPAEDYVSIYRTKKPGVRIIWSESERATSYELKIANNRNMNDPVFTQRTSQTSSIVSSLGAGNWYWTVTPYYTINGLGLANTSDVFSFRIEQSGALEKPALLLPSEDGLVSTQIPVNGQQTTYKTVNFSWKDNPEAVSYEFKLWDEKNEQISNVQITENHYSINPAVTKIDNGLLYWQVTTTDVEGNTAKSEIRKFIAIDSDAEQRTLFPPDNYKLAQSRVQDIRYNWKTNIPYDATFQLATDANFEDIIHSETTSNTSVGGRNLKPGTYFWRITTEIGSLKLSTPKKTLYVIAPMSAPECISPADHSREVTRKGIPVQFKWSAVTGADYYQIKLYKAEDTENPVYERNFIESNNAVDVMDELIMDEMDEGKYIWTLQAFSQETVSSSRAAGYLATYNFTMKKLRPIALTEPANGTVFGGIEAVKEPSNFDWYTVDEPSKSQIIIYKDKIDDNNVFAVLENPKRKQKMPQLYQGQYFWRIIAETEDDLDISSVESRNFAVAAMPKLPAPEMIYPTSKTLIDIDYIIEKGQTVHFEWKAVANADRYILKLYNKNDPSPVFEKTFGADTTDYIFEGDYFTDTLGKANAQWLWSIEAQNDYEGKLLQRGLVEYVTFAVDIPRNKPGDEHLSEENEVRYGTDSSTEAKNAAAAEKKTKKSTSDSKTENKTQKTSAKTKKKKKKVKES